MSDLWVEQAVWCVSFGAAAGASVVTIALIGAPMTSHAPAEQRAFLFFGAAFVLHSLAIMDPFPLTTWAPLIAAIIVCAVLASFGGKLARSEPLVPEAVVQASTPARVMTALGVLLVGAFYARISGEPVQESYISWVPLLIIGHLIAVAGRFVGKLLRDPTKRSLMNKQQALVVAGVAAAYVSWQLGSLSGEHLLDWRHYGIAVAVLTLGAIAGTMFTNSTAAASRGSVPPAVRNPGRSAVVTSSQRNSSSATVATSSVGRIAGDAKNRHYGEAALPTRLLDHFDDSEVRIPGQASPNNRVSPAAIGKDTNSISPQHSPQMQGETKASKTPHPDPTRHTESNSLPPSPPTEKPVEHAESANSAGATSSIQAETREEISEAPDTTSKENEEREGAEEHGEEEGADEVGGEKPSPASRSSSATAQHTDSDRPSSASSSKGKSKSKRRGHKSRGHN